MSSLYSLPCTLHFLVAVLIPDQGLVIRKVAMVIVSTCFKILFKEGGYGTFDPLLLNLIAFMQHYNQFEAQSASSMAPMWILCNLCMIGCVMREGDLVLIDFIKEILCESRVEVVLIDDAFVERKLMECLFQPNAYFGDEVIDCYINLIKAQKHLKCRSGGRVHIENAFQFNFLKRDGDVEIKTGELYPIKDMSQICSAERRVLLYLDHDMVFILINIRETHWYLAVINARNMEIQVLDSLGTSQDHKDLTDSDHMSHFRETMAAILLSSDLNKRKGCPLYNYEKEVDTGNPFDVAILDIPTNPKKRKLLHMLDDSEVVFEDEECHITQADLQRWFLDDWDKRTPVKVSTHGCTNDFLMGGLSTKDMLVTKADLIDVLCDYIMAIQDDTTLE
ncbi:putative ubiquitin-like-specific protease 1B [Zea mays]|uniref:Putative ubiquitin-like-specific protease 1B n=1 Tax=Zea mays TaxID=4577 RepID=A0A3L6EWD3_MAIZE|nr:putative ubiquitin-like-specific protease 1B [Zea mays]